MAIDDTPLTDEERAELEQLRAEKAARERAELEQLRAQHRSVPRQETDAQRRARELMEPGDDLSMPVAQKIVLIVLAVIVLAVIGVYLWASR